MTPDQIDHAQVFHYARICADEVGPRGGHRYTVERWRRNGATQRWKRDPQRFRIPIKFGLREYGEITPSNVSAFHAAEDCPVEELRY